MSPATLTRDDGSATCSTCAQAKGRNAPMATYTLTKSDGRRWRLCLGCACRASHALGIMHRTFNPTGAVAVVGA